MALVKCKECGKDVSDRAAMCPHCGITIRGMAYGYERRSEAELLGLPLLHIAYGVNPETGLPRIARGIVAIGNFAVGFVALGGFAFGGLCFGGISLGLVSFAGLSCGLLLALGGLSIGTVAIGGLAVGYYALGGAAFGVHALGENARDPAAVEFFRGLLGEWVERVGRSR